MNFEGGNPKSKGIGRSKKLVNLGDVFRKIDNIARSNGMSPQTRKEISKALDKLVYFTYDDLSVCNGKENNNG